MSYYFNRLKHNRNYKIIFLVIFILMTLDILILNSQMENYDPNFSTFLAGSSLGHYMQMLILWLIPAYVLLGESSWFILDEKTKNSSILISKFGKRKYIIYYLLNVLFSTFILIFANLIINYIIVNIINHGGTISQFSYQGSDYSGIGNLQEQLDNPIIANIIFIITTSFFIALYAVFTSCLSFLFTKLSHVFLLSFALWFIIISGDYSILLAFQPFAEYSFQYIGKIYIILSIILMLSCLILSIYKVKKDAL